MRTPPASEPPRELRVQMLLDYAPQVSDREVPDPYYEGTAVFERVLDLCEAACAGLLQAIRQGRLAPR